MRHPASLAENAAIAIRDRQGVTRGRGRPCHPQTDTVPRARSPKVLSMRVVTRALGPIREAPPALACVCEACRKASIYCATKCAFMGLTCWKMFLKCSHRIIRRGNMVREQDDARRRAFSIWVRTGRLPPVRSASGVEFKFNPWHDPENGRFTFAGTGRYYGRGGDRAKDQVGRGHGVEYVDDPSQPPITSMEEADAWRASELARHGHKPQYREAIEARYLVYKSAFANERGATTANEPLPSQREAHAGPHHYRTREPSPVRQINRSGDAHVSQGPSASARSGIGGGDFFGGGGATGGWDAPASPGAYAGFRDADSVALDKRSSEPGG